MTLARSRNCAEKKKSLLYMRWQLEVFHQLLLSAPDVDALRVGKVEPQRLSNWEAPKSR